MDRGLAADWQVVPSAEWNYALRINSSDRGSLRIVEKRGAGGVFTESGSEVSVIAKASEVPGWEEVQGSAGELPASPAETTPSTTELTLIPCGAAKLRITAFPQAS